MNSLTETSLILFESLSKLDKTQLKAFYCLLVHYRVSQQVFISKQNAFNLWCELNVLCHEIDEGFPDITDHELIKSYCHAHPYYFIDILDAEIVVKLFCEYLDDKLDILATMAQKLDTEGIRATYAYANEVLGLNEDIEDLVAQTEEHVDAFS